MRFRQWFEPPHHLLTLFLAITLVLATGLGWLGWRILEQDRALEGQRVQERLSQVADLVSASLSRTIAGLDERLGGISALPEPAVAREASRLAQELGSADIIVVFHPQGIDAYPRSRLVYYPSLPIPKEPSERVFAAGESFEFREKDYAKAMSSYRELARSPDALIRAGALLRLARVLRKMHQPKGARAVYENLAKLDPTPIGGVPAGLVARATSCELLFGMNRPTELEREAGALYLDLTGGRWRLTRATYQFYEQEVSGWLSSVARREADRRIIRPTALALAAGVDSLWDEWQRIRQGETTPTGRRSLWVYDHSVFLLWRSTTERLAGLVAAPRYFEEQWRGPLEPFERQGVRVTLTDAEGHLVLGQNVGVSTHRVTRATSDTQLPWTLRVASTNSVAEVAESASRRRLLLAGLGLMALVVLAGSYFITRAVTRELEVARLQSEFVSAVSHEFRTPLATLKQFSELLADGRVSSEERRQQYYEGLRREGDRLHRLVENLLDFGRMEAGKKEYRFEALDPYALVRNLVEEFREEVRDSGYQVEISADHDLPPVRADREALGRALWNLLDNAVKYSPHSKTVWVEAARNGRRVSICVRDQGLGIPAQEQKEIFKKFVRAEAARGAGVKGTGLGLAMVKHIATAHGGEVRVESRPGAGSTFTLVLPAAKN